MGILNYLFTVLTLVCILQLRVLAKPLPLQGDFESQVSQIIQEQQLTQKDWAAIRQAMDDVIMAVEASYPGSEFWPFGSVFVGLGNPKSDVDMIIKPNIKPIDSNTSLVEAVVRALNKYPDLFTDVSAGPTRIPTTHAFHILSNRDVELSYISYTGISNTRLVNYFLHLDNRALKLATIIKYWIQNADVHHELPSYVFVLLVIFYLQQKYSFPSVAQLQEGLEPFIVDTWNVAFEEKPFSLSADVQFFDMVTGFFEYYADFEFEKYVISPFLGYPVLKSEFFALENQHENYLYESQLNDRRAKDPFSFGGLFTIQEPFEHSRNVGLSIHGRAMCKSVMAALQRAYELYQENSDPDEYLASISKIRIRDH